MSTWSSFGTPRATAGDYVGITGLTPEERFLNHKNGVKAASVVHESGRAPGAAPLRPPEPDAFAQAVEMEVDSPTASGSAATGCSEGTDEVLMFQVNALRRREVDEITGHPLRRDIGAGARRTRVQAPGAHRRESAR